MNFNSSLSRCCRLLVSCTVAFALLLKTDAQSATPTVPFGVASETPTPSPTYNTIYGSGGGVGSPTPTAVANSACPVGSFNAAGLNPDWAATCSHCIPRPTNIVRDTGSTLAASVPTSVFPLYAIPAISLTQNATIIPPTPSLVGTSTPSGSVTPSITPTPTVITGNIELNFRTSSYGLVHVWTAPGGAWQSGTGFVPSAYQFAYGANGRYFQGYIDLWALGYKIQKVSHVGISVTSSANTGWYGSFSNVAGVHGARGVWGGGANVNQDVNAPSVAWSVLTPARYVQIEMQVAGTTLSTWSELHIRADYIWEPPAAPSPSPSPTVTRTPTITPTVPWSEGGYNRAPQNCSVPQYVSTSPAVEVVVGTTGQRACFTLFPGVQIEATTFFGISVDAVNFPAFEICIVPYDVLLKVVGITIDIGLLIAAPLFAFLFRWLMFN